MVERSMIQPVIDKVFHYSVTWWPPHGRPSSQSYVQTGQDFGCVHHEEKE